MTPGGPGGPGQAIGCGQSAGMRTDHVLRTAILAAWLVALLVHAPLTARTTLIGVAVALIAAVPLLRRRVTPTRHNGYGE